MASSLKAPKQWMLQSDADVTQFESWKNNLLFTLSLDDNYKPFLKSDATWGKKTKANPKRGFTDDAAGAGTQTADQKVYLLELMLGQIANYSPINRSTITKNSTSLVSVWSAIRQHLNIEANGARVLDLANLTLIPGERPEVLYERLLAFVDDNLMRADGGIKHHGEDITDDEELTPTIENMIVVIWLKLLHKDLPKKVKDRYATDLKSRSLASIKNEISSALDSLLEEVQASQDSRAMRASANSNGREWRDPGSRDWRESRNQSWSEGKSREWKNTPGRYRSNQERSDPECPLCVAAKRPYVNHHLSGCKYLPEKDRKYITRARSSTIESGDEEENDGHSDTYDYSGAACARSVDIPPTARRVPVESSPFLDVYYKHHSVRITIDSGGTANFIRRDVAVKMNVNIRKHSQNSHQADGSSPLKIVGETTITFSFKHHRLVLEALVAQDLDEEILGGIPFMNSNDIWIRPRHKFVAIGDDKYYYSNENSPALSSKRLVAETIRCPESLTVWPGEFIEVPVPVDFQGQDVALEPRTDTPVNSKCSDSQIWPQPQIIKCNDNVLRIPNLSESPKSIKKGEHFCQIRNVSVVSNTQVIQNASDQSSSTTKKHIKDDKLAYKDISIDPQNITPPEYSERFKSICESYSHVFNTKFRGYNGRDGAVKAIVNMGPVLPPQRKGRMPLYNKDKLLLLQNKFDELEELGVFEKPENIGVNVEYLNSSFLVRKPRGGYRLVTDFADVGRYSKPQPSLLPDMDSTLRSIAQWKYLIQTDLCKAYFQIPLDPSSMKYCGVATPFKGIRVYARSAMGMPGSESALEEVMCRVLGNMIEAGKVVKLADNLYCGANSLSELCNNWEELLKALSRNNLHLSASQTVINPKSSNILGWVWTQGILSASPHSICTLSTCKLPETVTQLRSFVGAYKVLSRVMPMCAEVMAPFDNMTAGRPSSEKLTWSNQNIAAFEKAQSHISSETTNITIPQKSDKLWIVLDAATRKPALGSTLYLERPGDKKLRIGGFFSAKLNSNQIDWLPCEREALCAGSSVKYFQSYIIQSEHKTACLTDNKPCVQAYEKMMKGEFSASPRVSTFLSICHRFQVTIQHISGVDNALADHGSRNPAECDDGNCQVCRFVSEVENSVVRAFTVDDILSGKQKLPFLSRKAWQSTQLEDADLRRTHAHLKQGTRPSRKVTNIRDVKRYLNSVTIARDGLLVVRNDEPGSIVNERVVVPRSVIDGLLSSYHIKLDHPSAHQLKQIANRYFYALDLDNAIERVSSSCHLCTSLATLNHVREAQSSSDPPDAIGIQFAADVIRRERQYIFTLREKVTSYTWSMLIPNEQANTLRDAILKLSISYRPIDGPSALVRVDDAPGFISLKDDELLSKYGITLDLGRIKNKNKNPIAERAIEELEQEILKQDPKGGAVDDITLTIATARLNTRIRNRGLSAREMLFQRDQFTNEQIPISDRNLIIEQHEIKMKNHTYSEKSKAPLKDYRPDNNIHVGDLVYLYKDKDKTRARDRYIVVSTDVDWLFIRKFTGQQLRNASYKVKRNECYKVPNAIPQYDPSVEHVIDHEELEVMTPNNNESVTIHTDDTSSDPVSLPEIPEDIIPNHSDNSLQLSLNNPQDSDSVKPTEVDAEINASLSSKPQRARKPPDKLCIKWDNSKSYV